VHWKFPDTASAIALDGVVIVSALVETVPPNARTLPVIITLLLIVTPDASSMIPANWVFAPSVVA